MVQPRFFFNINKRINPRAGFFFQSETNKVPPVFNCYFCHATGRVIAPSFGWGRKVRTAQGNVPVKSRVILFKAGLTDSATENNFPAKAG